MELPGLQGRALNLSTPRAHAMNGKGDGRSLLSPCWPSFSAPRECFMLLGSFSNRSAPNFHWSREEISGFLSISGVIFAVASPIVGRLADRFGVRRVILICVVLVAVIYGSQSLLTRHLWHYYALAFLWGPATAGTSALTFGKVISNWFDRSRGLALSILACGSGLGGVVIPPFAQSLIAHYGWREAYLLLGLSILTVGVIPVALVLEDAPPMKATNITSSAGETFAAARVPRSQVFRSYTFLTLIAVVVILGISNGVLTHLIPMLTDRGMTPAAAARLSLLAFPPSLDRFLLRSLSRC